MWSLLLLLPLLAANAGGLHHDVWVDPSAFHAAGNGTTTATAKVVATLLDAVALAADRLATTAAAAGEVTIHLAPGRHYVDQQLRLDSRHHNIRFLGHGTPAEPSSVSGGIQTSDWAVVGTAHCRGCTQIWRAPTPKGVDSRQFYVNGERANRTWRPFLPSGLTPEYNASASQHNLSTDIILVAGDEAMLSWKHNTSAIELVYRGTYSAGSQWQESRCPVAAISKTPPTVGPQPSLMSEGDPLNQCAASHCPLANCPICCGMPGTVDANRTVQCTAAPTKSCRVMCGPALPFCVDYVANQHWGHCAETQPPPPQLHGVQVTVAQPCAGNGNAKCGGSQALKIPAYVENVFELLGHPVHGSPGQFYLDAAAGFVYYVPHASQRPESTVGVLPTTEVLVDAEGAHNLSHSNLVYEHATWMRPSTTLGFVDVQSGCESCRRPNPRRCHLHPLLSSLADALRIPAIVVPLR